MGERISFQLTPTEDLEMYRGSTCRYIQVDDANVIVFSGFFCETP